MLAALLFHLIAIPCFAIQLTISLPAEGWQHVWKRLPLFFLAWVLFSSLAILHMFGHLLDMLIFPGYRKSTVRNPVFILGIPRSGTTYLQRRLARIPEFTTLTTWEALLAPSITEKYLFTLLGKCLLPLEQGIISIRKKFFHQMDSIHEIRLQEPEEDFLLLLPVLGCLLPVFACPGSRHFWQLGYFDEKVPERFRKMLMTYYRTCLQKHLAFHGAHKRLLSKNPSFTSWMGSLFECFPDARVIACTRPPMEVIPSQLSSLRPAMTVLGNGRLSLSTQDKLLCVLYNYYQILTGYYDESRLLFLPISALREGSSHTMNSLQDFLFTDQSASPLIAEQQNSMRNTYRSNHHYSLADFGLNEQEINNRFKPVWPLTGLQKQDALKNRPD